MNHTSHSPLSPLAPIELSANRIIARRLVEACRQSTNPARWTSLEIRIARHLDAVCRARLPVATVLVAVILLGIDPAGAAETACSCARVGAVVAVISTVVGATLGAVALALVASSSARGHL
jgi:hypothetical protein